MAGSNGPHVRILTVLSLLRLRDFFEPGQLAAVGQIAELVIPQYSEWPKVFNVLQSRRRILASRGGFGKSNPSPSNDFPAFHPTTRDQNGISAKTLLAMP